MSECCSAPQQIFKSATSIGNKMVPALKLHYFACAGRAEAIRLTLRLGGIPFEDVQFSKANWPEIKPNFPFLQVPCLEVDGVMLPQTEAILRYAGRLANFYPSDALEAARVDSVVAYIFNEVFDMFVKWIRASDDDKPVIKKSIMEELPNAFDMLDKYVASITQGQYVAVEMSIADILLFEVLHTLESGNAPFLSSPLKGFVEKFPRLNTIYEAVLVFPRVKELLQK